MAPKSRPVLVVVPGATQTPSHYAHLIYLLQSQGWGTLTALLPSVGASTPVTAEDDAEYVRTRMLLPILDVEKHDIIMIMHSYSGLPGSAAARGLGPAARAAAGKTTAVLGQIFVATILPPGGDGRDVIQNLDGNWPPHIDVYRDEDRMKCDEPRGPLYFDVPEQEAAAAELSAISHSLTSFESPCPPCSWNTPDFAGRVAYVRAVNDAAIPPEIQSEMLKRTGVDWIVRDIAAGHSPQLAQPEQLKELILELIPRFTGAAPEAEAGGSPMQSVHETKAADAPAGAAAVAASTPAKTDGATTAKAKEPNGSAAAPKKPDVVSSPAKGAEPAWLMRKWRSLKHHLK